MSPRNLPYHRLARLRPEAARWWRPIVVVVGAAAIAVVLFFVLLIGGLLASLIPGVPGASPELDDPGNPMDTAMGLGILAVMTPAVLGAYRFLGGRRGAAAGTVHSVAGRFRWTLALRAAAVVIPVFAVVNGASVVLSGASFDVPQQRGMVVALLLIVLLAVPLQCAAEEYVFRALPMQVCGTWLRSPLWGILLPVPLFVIGHEYDVWGQIDIAVFAVAMGLLTWKTGGIELPIVVHTANNLTLFLMSPFAPATVAQGPVDPRALLISIPVTVLTTLALWLWVSRREGLDFLIPVRGTERSPADGDHLRIAVLEQPLDPVLAADAGFAVPGQRELR